MNITVDIQGLKGVEDALASAGPKLAKRAMRKALAAGAAKFVAEAQALAPVKTGRLKLSIKAVTKLSPKQESGRTRVGATGRGKEDPGKYELYQEFGTRHQPARPFLRPAFDSQHEAAKNAFAEVMADEVKKLDR